jgi:hypothetical protein
LLNQAIKTQETQKMNKREIISEGLLRGYSVAKNIDLVDIGDYCDRDVLQTSERVKVTSDNWFEVHTNIAGECESDARQFSPFEFLANDINATDDNPRVKFEPWYEFDEAIGRGIAKALKERWKSIRMTKKDYEKSFSGSSDLFNACWRKFLAYQSATGEPDFNENIEVEILLDQFSSEIVNDSSSRFYIYG